MKKIRDFRIEVQPQVPACPGAMMDRAIISSLIEFCEYTRTWRATLDPIKVRENVSDYTFELPECSRFVSVHFASHNDIRIVPTTEGWEDSQSTTWRALTAEQAVGYYMPDRSTLRLVNIPDTTTAKALDLIVELKPTQDATEVPDDLYEDHLEAIGHGALKRLLTMANKPWMDLKGAVYHGVEFDRAMKKEKAERANDYTRTSKFRITGHNYYG